MKLFKNDLASRLVQQLEDLFPQDCIEARFSAFDLNLIQFNPSHTAGLERMFKSLKEMKTKSRNRLSDKRTKKLMMILNFIDDVKIDLDRIAEIFKSSS